MTPRYRLSPGNGPRPTSLEPADDCDGSLLGPDEDERDEPEYEYDEQTD